MGLRLTCTWSWDPTQCCHGIFSAYLVRVIVHDEVRGQSCALSAECMQVHRIAEHSRADPPFGGGCTWGHNYSGSTCSIGEKCPLCSSHVRTAGGNCSHGPALASPLEPSGLRVGSHSAEGAGGKFTGPVLSMEYNLLRVRPAVILKQKQRWRKLGPCSDALRIRAPPPGARSSDKTKYTTPMFKLQHNH